MRKLKDLYFQSYFSYLVSLFVLDFIPRFWETFKNSIIMKLWLWIDSKIIKSKPVRLFFDTEFFANTFYKSYFYRSSTLYIRRASYNLPKASISFNCAYIGAFIAVILLIPHFLWADSFWMPVFAALTIFYISRNIRERTGTVFVLINTLLVLFALLLELAIPHKTLGPVFDMLLGIDLFFLISFSVKNREDLKILLLSLFVSALILCSIGIFQNTAFRNDATAVFGNGETFGEIIILIFPFAFLYATEFEIGKRRWIYMAVLFILSFNVVAATHSKSALIGFLIEVFIFILADIKFFPFLIFLMPLGLGTIIKNIQYTWHTATTQGDPLNNIITLFRQIWKSGFGVDSQLFIDLYTSSRYRTPGENTLISIPFIETNPVYLNFIIDMGAVLLFFFMFYILRLAHSSFTSLFIADKKYRRYFTAGLATLVGISVSSFFEINFFYSRILLIYWAMLGILRSIRIISLGVYES